MNDDLEATLVAMGILFAIILFLAIAKNCCGGTEEEATQARNRLSSRPRTGITLPLSKATDSSGAKINSPQPAHTRGMSDV